MRFKIPNCLDRLGSCLRLIVSTPWSIFTQTISVLVRNGELAMGTGNGASLMESSRSKSDRVAWTYLSQEKYNPRTVRAGRASNRQGEQTFYSARSPRISYPANKSETLNQSAYRSPFLSISTAYRSFPRKRSQHFKRENKRSQGRQWITACATYFRYHVSSPLRSIDFRFERKPRPASW